MLHLAIFATAGIFATTADDDVLLLPCVFLLLPVYAGAGTGLLRCYIRQQRRRGDGVFATTGDCRCWKRRPSKLHPASDDATAGDSALDAATSNRRRWRRRPTAPEITAVGIAASCCYHDQHGGARTAARADAANSKEGEGGDRRQVRRPAAWTATGGEGGRASRLVASLIHGDVDGDRCSLFPVRFCRMCFL